MFKNNNKIILSYIIFLLVCSGIILLFSKDYIHIFINKHHHAIADVFFKYYTFVGDGFFNLFLFFILIFIKYRWAWMVAASGTTTMIIVSVMKHIIYNGELRPLKFFDGIYNLNLVEGVDVHLYNSFPSGHTAGAFSLFFLFALISKKQYIKFFFLTIAILVGYSRMYLSQHFLVDVAMGAFIGGMVSLTCYFIFENILKKRYDGALGLNLFSKFSAFASNNNK